MMAARARSTPRYGSWPALSTLLAGLLLCVAGAGQAAASEPVPVEVRVDASRIAPTGDFTLRFEFTPREDLARRYRLRVALDTGGELYLTSDHELEPPTTAWRAGTPVDWELDLRLPPDCALEAGETVAVLVGFLAPRSHEPRPPADVRAGPDGLADAAWLPMPAYYGAAGAARLEAIFAEASHLASAGDAPAAWDLLDEGLRAASDDATKERFRDRMVKIGRFEPRPLSPPEESIVRARIRAEKVRYFRLTAGRMYDRGELHGALRLLEEAGGSLAESADEAVIGALDEAKRVTRDIDDIRRRLCEEPTAAELALVDERVAELDLTRELLEEAEELVEERRYAAALEMLRRLRKSDFDDVEDEARARIPEVSELHVAATPPDQVEKVRAAVEHEAWARTDVAASHCFLYIGPRKLVEGIPQPSQLRFDLAYVFLTDLFGRRPNPGGDRVTVYFKELFEFGGGIGGGKIIDIGKRRPRTPGQVPCASTRACSTTS